MADNIDRFNDTVAIILLKLHENFPKRIFLTVPDIELSELDFDNKEHMEKFCHFIDTASWLEEQGYILVQSKTNGGYSGCTLSEKSFAVLNNKPAILNGETLAEGLKEAAKLGIKDTVRDYAKLAITSGVGYVTGLL